MMKQKANDTVVDLVTTELNEIKTSNTDKNEMFKEFIITAKQDKAQKMIMREAKMRREEDRIMVIDAFTMTPQQASYY